MFIIMAIHTVSCVWVQTDTIHCIQYCMHTHKLTDCLDVYVHKHLAKPNFNVSTCPAIWHTKVCGQFYNPYNINMQHINFVECASVHQIHQT